LKKARIEFTRESKRVEVAQGASLLDAAAEAGMEMEAACGGLGKCGKCRVRAAGDIEPPTPEEQKLLGEEALTSGVRLACRTRVAGDASAVFIDPAISSEIYPFRMEFVPDPNLQCAPTVKKFVIKTSDLKKAGSGTPFERLAGAAAGNVRFNSLSSEHAALLDELAATPKAVFTALTDGGELCGVTRGVGGGRLLGAAVDIGTTTLNARIVDLADGRVLGSVGAANPQRLFGADIASRINLIIEKKGGLETLRSRVVQRVRGMLERLAADAGASANDICRITIVGNPTMTNIFLGIDPRAIAFSPYIAPVSRAMTLDAAAVGLNIAPGARLAVLPGVAAYVGADAVAAAMRVRLHERGKPRLLVDLGTNAEMMLTDGEKIYCCAAAAGPALEGAHIRFGVTAADGAIDRVDFTPEYAATTIGDAPPRGLCGTGLLDTVAGLLDTGLLSTNGRLAAGDADSLRAGHSRSKQATDGENDSAGIGAPALQPTDTSDENGWERRHLARKESSQPMPAGEDNLGTPYDIALTQKDIREVQLAAGAIRAGAELMMKHAGVRAEDLDAVYLAGALGTYLRAATALRAGLVPRVDARRIRFTGNAALDGATEALISTHIWDQARALADAASYIELSSEPDFPDLFAANLKFPEDL